MNRRDVHFSLRDAALRKDVSLLGSLVGEVIEEQGGMALFHLVESVRLAAIHRRECEPDAAAELLRLVEAMNAHEAGELVRAFSLYFQVVNLAEKIHRIRRDRDAHLSGGEPEWRGLLDAMQKLVRNGVGLKAMASLLKAMRIEPVFTAHPTEATRRSILEKHFRIAQRLGERLNPALTPREDRAIIARIRMEMTALWQTEEHPDTRRTVRDELEHVLFYITDILYRIVPAFYESLEDALDGVYGNVGRDLVSPTLIRFASWVGGDMDGNPNVTADTVRQTLVHHRALIFKTYREELNGLYHQLSQSMSRVGVSAAVQDRLADYTLRFRADSQGIPERHRNMPYRVLLRLMQARLDATERDLAEGYGSPEQFVDDLQIVTQSLHENKGDQAGLFSVRRLMRRAETFGFHLAALDVRQDALMHRTVMGKLMGEADWVIWPVEKRTERLLAALVSDVKPVAVDDADVQRTLAVFRAVDDCRRQFGAGAIGPYIVSMTQDMDDVYTVLLLAKWAGLMWDDGSIPIDVAPLFETVPDLNHAPRIMTALLDSDFYRAHLASRDDRQIVMIGYSDSNKDGGIVAARWALHQTQVALVQVMEPKGVELTIFHGRGGTVSRGGGKLERAILSAPHGTVRGRLRVTEQGEIINAKYGLRGIAIQELEQMAGAVMQASTLSTLPDERDPKWQPVLDTLAQASRRAYRALVYDDPDFLHYFRHATPIDVIERMQIGSRPSARRSQRGIEDLRAIPWVFSWTQSRQILPGWFGLGAGLEAAVSEHGDERVAEVVRTDPFLGSLLEDLEMVLAKTDMDIGARYAELAGDRGQRIFEGIQNEYRHAVDQVLALKGNRRLLDDDPTLQRALRLREPYVDPMSLLQVDLLRRWRASDREDDEVFAALLATVNGIAEGLQNTG